MDTRLLHSHRGPRLTHSHTEQSPSSDDSFSIPSPQLVEKSGVSTPELFFYELDCPSEDSRTNVAASINLHEQLKSSARGVNSSTLKRHLDTIQTRKLPTAEEKHRETALRTANLFRQRAYSPLLTLDKNTVSKAQASHKGESEQGKLDAKLQPYQHLLTRPPPSRLAKDKELVRKSIKKVEVEIPSKVQAISPSLSKAPRAPLKATAFKGKTLKPLRSLTPQLGRVAPAKSQHK